MRTWWIPLTFSGLVALWALWPRQDGGGIPYSLAALSGPIHWIIFGGMLLPWVIWAIAVGLF